MENTSEDQADPSSVQSTAKTTTPSTRVTLTNQQFRLGEVSLGKVTYRAIGRQLSVNGRLAVPAQSQFSITALLGGFIRRLPLLTGQPIRKGQLIAQVENLDLIQTQQDYAENYSRLIYLEAEYARQQELSQQSVSALKVFQQTTADRNQLRARLTGLAQRLHQVGIAPPSPLAKNFSAFYEVRAPVTGVITDVPATTGQFIQPADIIVRLTSNQGLYAELTVFERDLPFIREGQRVLLDLTSETRKQRSGRITYINRSVEVDRTVRVLVALDTPDGRLAPNTFLKARIDLGASQVPALPDEAIVSVEGKAYIFVVTNANDALVDTAAAQADGTTFQLFSINRGVSEGGYTQVKLPAGFDRLHTQVVIRGAYAMLSQLKGGVDPD